MDKEDEEALRNMDGERVRWTPKEMTVVSVCLLVIRPAFLCTCLYITLVCMCLYICAGENENTLKFINRFYI